MQPAASDTQAPFPLRQLVHRDEELSHRATGTPRGSSEAARAKSPSPVLGRERPAAPLRLAAIGTVVSSLRHRAGLVPGPRLVLAEVCPGGHRCPPKEAVELLGPSPAGRTETMQLIRIGNRLLLVALSASGARNAD